jgi:c-di-GMP-binding flagellar brake protein YcgR
METEEKGRRPRVGIVNLEKRKHPRFSVDLPIEYYQTNSSIRQAGRLMNASGGGLLVYFPEQMEIGQHLKMKLFFSFGSGLNFVEILTEVVWEDIRLGKDWGDYRYGVRVIDISKDDLSKLKNFLRSLSE